MLPNKYKSIEGWNIRTGRRLPKYHRPISQPRSTTLNFGGDDGKVNAEPGAIVIRKKPIPGYKGINQSDVHSASAFAPDGIWALALKDIVSENHEVIEGNVRVSLNSYRQKTPYNVAKSLLTPVTAMAFSADSNFLATGGRTETDIQLWNVKTRKLLRSLTTQTNGITALAFSKDGMLASGSRDGTITLWGTSD